MTAEAATVATAATAAPPISRTDQAQAARTGMAYTIARHVVVLAVVNVILVYVAPADRTALRLAVASLTMWVASYPTLHFALRDENQVPAFPVINAMYFMYFGLPVFLHSVEKEFRAHRYAGSPAETIAVALTLAGLILMQIAFYTPVGKMFDLLPRVKPRVEVERLSWYFLAVAIAGEVGAAVFYLSRNIPEEFRALFNVGQRLPLMFLAGAFLVGLRGKLSRLQWTLGAVCYFVHLVFALSTGNLAHVMFVLAPMFFVYVAERRRLPWLAGIIAIVALVPFSQAKYSFRNEVRRSNVSGFDRVPLIFEVAFEQMTRSDRFLAEASSSSARRMDNLGGFTVVVEETPRRIPYAEGETYKIMLWSFLPRVIAPDKPLQGLGQDYGHRYRFLTRDDHHTSVNLPQIVEMYMNFGSWGVFVGMVLLGFYYRAMYRLFNDASTGDGTLLLAAATFAGLLNVESDASGVLVGGVQGAIISYVVLRVMVAIGNAGFQNTARA